MILAEMLIEQGVEYEPTAEKLFWQVLEGPDQDAWEKSTSTPKSSSGLSRSSWRTEADGM